MDCSRTHKRCTFTSEHRRRHIQLNRRKGRENVNKNMRRMMYSTLYLPKTVITLECLERKKIKLVLIITVDITTFLKLFVIFLPFIPCALFLTTDRLTSWIMCLMFSNNMLQTWKMRCELIIVQKKRRRVISFQWVIKMRLEKILNLVVNSVALKTNELLKIWLVFSIKNEKYDQKLSTVSHYFFLMSFLLQHWLADVHLCSTNLNISPFLHKL
uniref:Transmembrane protein n=1 Tax=Heterorhabditis bacteriophora TaxID=37862 RepID=A0A1I7X137_HETBA